MRAKMIGLFTIICSYLNVIQRAREICNKEHLTAGWRNAKKVLRDTASPSTNNTLCMYLSSEVKNKILNFKVCLYYKIVKVKAKHITLRW